MKLQYRHYVLGVLLIAYVSNAMDRAVLSVLLPAIKEEFTATDTQLGLLGGMGFAFFYAVFGLPLAAWADRGDRRGILAVCVLAWSVATAWCGSASSLGMLLIARMATAIGEAGGGPPSHSLISDYFGPTDRGTAMAVFALGVPIGAMLGNFAGGWLGDAFGWRAAFLMLGALGLPVALLTAVTVREPARGAQEPAAARVPAQALPVIDSLRALWAIRSFRNLCMAAALHSFVLYGANVFNAVFLVRSHGMSGAQAGTLMGLASLLSTAGTFAAGYCADRAGRRTGDSRWYLWLPGIATVLCVPLQVTVYQVREPPLMVACFLGLAVFGAAYFGPTYAMTQALAPLRARAMATAVLLFVQTLIGLGLGPPFVGMVSDAFAALVGAAALSWALVMAAAFNIAAAGFYLRSAQTLRQDLLRSAEGAAA